METSRFGNLANEDSINKTIAALKFNGIDAEIVPSGKEAIERVLALLPPQAEVMQMTSTSLIELGLDKILADDGKFDSIRNKLNSMDKEAQGMEMQRLGAAQAWAIGSVHAVTENGNVVVASATGSQLGAYAYGAQHVIWVVGTQKIVRNLDEAFKRVYDYVFPLENERAMKAYGMGSGVNKLLIVNKEVAPGRIHLIFVKEKLGF